MAQVAGDECAGLARFKGHGVTFEGPPAAAVVAAQVIGAGHEIAALLGRL